ncbi:hypothetical protein BGZ83_006656 [Gryganskiella cystojenkinii]|nr:hypothetical protein BGZ83_006656 [Gryganskiella cystojenkinii]
MTGSWDYLPQIRKAWADRTPNMSWPLSTAFFTSVLATVLAITALILNWEVQCTYLKVFLIVFVARKWIITVLMFDRALYRLPLGLTEPDPDIDEERHNGIAIYLTRLFTWHGYAMFFFGSCYVFVYGFSRYLSSAPVIVGVAMTFACMGLTPFFALLLLVFLTMALLYFLYLVLMCMIWPCERCGLTRRRAISRRNGGYQSSGTTNTTDLRQVAQALEDGEAGQRSGGGFGTVDSLKITPAMAAIPIVIFRKPKKVADSKTVPSSPSSTTTSNGAGVSGGRDEKDPAMAVSTHMNTLPVVVLRSNRLDSGAATPQRTPSRPTTVLIASLTPGQTSTDRLDGGSSGVRDQSSSSSSSSSSTGSLQSRRASRVLGELPVTIDIPPVPALINNSDNDSQNDAINRMPISMSALCNYTSTSGGGIAGYDQNRTNAARSRSASLTLDTVITIPPPLPAVPTSASLSTNLTTSGIGSVANTPAMSSVPIPFNQSARPLSQASSIASFIPCASAHEMDESEHRRSAYLQPTPIPNPVSAAGALTNTTTSVITNAAIASSGLNVLNHLDRAYLRANTPLTGVKSSTSASSQQQTQASVLSAASITATVSTGTPSIEEEDENYPVITDEECAICLFDFEHGDQLRHLPCDHFFHQTCVDRWLVKNAFCPKCKRGI